MNPSFSLQAEAAAAHVAAGRLPEAIEAYEALLAEAPGDTDLRTRLALAQRTEGDLDAAIGNFERVLGGAPDSDIARLNLALALDEAGDTSRALELIACAHALIETSPMARWMAAWPLLRSGDYVRGFDYFEARWQSGAPAFAPGRHAAPQWRGEAGNGRTLLLWNEQGLGDAIQFIRFAERAAACGFTVVVDVARQLRALVASAPGVAAVVDAATRRYDVHLPLMSLPHALGLELGQVATAFPYLAAPADRREKWRTLLPESKAMRIGLVWRSTVNNNDLAVAQSKLSKSLPLALLRGFAAVAGAEVVSLQVGHGVEEIANAGVRITDLSAHIDDFADTAAAIDRLDLVVSIDTAAAHLAGALGKPVFVLLNHSPCWRWMAGRDDSPWYPSARLFRQAARNDWRAPVDAAVAAARALAPAKRGGPLRRWWRQSS